MHGIVLKGKKIYPNEVIIAKLVEDHRGLGGYKFHHLSCILAG